ncbi:MAG: recombination protein RecR [Clostridia bacterium]|nr:recombination protein RecR [Clostridia bacterium]
MTPSLERLVEQFSKLPSIGRKTATRLAYHVLSLPESEVRLFASALIDAKTTVKLCSVCGTLSEYEKCDVCSDERRDGSVICVVEDSRSMSAIEETREFKGVYHVLGGVISPLDGIGPEQLKVKELVRRLDGTVKEIIVATNPSIEGESTAMYLKKLLAPHGVKVTRLAYGLQVGATLEYADVSTLSKAIERRTEL